MKKKMAKSVIRLFATFLVAGASLFSYINVNSQETIAIPLEDKISNTVHVDHVEDIQVVIPEEKEEIEEEATVATDSIAIVPPAVPVVVTPPAIEGDHIEVAGITRRLMKDETGEHFYLNHNVNGEYDGIGVPYVDFRHDFIGRKTIIYSHSSLSGNGPFQALQNYHNNPGFYWNNRTITIQYQGNTYHYEIFSVYVSVADSEESEGLEYFHRMRYTDEEWEETLQKYKSNSEYDTGVSVSARDHILILQTCSMDPNYYAKYYRYNLLIMGKLIS